MRATITPLGTVRKRLGGPQPKATPYPDWLVTGVREQGGGDDIVYVSWELARTVTNATPIEREALTALASATLIALRGGSTHLATDELSERLAALGAEDDVREAAARVLEGDNEAIGGPGDYKPLIVDDERLYHQRIHRQETELANALKARIEEKANRADYMRILDALDRVLAHRAVVEGRAIQLSAAQQNAVRTALTRTFTVVSGGPGTGKTSIVVSILRVLARLDYPIGNVVLAAPTGRAARRMADSIDLGFGAVPEPKIVDASILDAIPKPRTLHRLLGYSPSRHRFRYDENHPLPYELVIVDEASMIDLELMYRLLRALRPETKLVLLGDADQLPSVHPGAVFRDIVAAGANRATVELTSNYRVNRRDAAARALTATFEAVRGGAAEPIAKSIRLCASAADVEFRGVELLEKDHESFFDRWFAERFMTPAYRELLDANELDAAAVFAHLRSHGILTVTNHDANRLNRHFASRNPSRVGAPMIVGRNDYDRGLFNGERGVVTANGVRFETGAREATAFTSELAPAYAITVHKSQGAELDHVALVLPAAEHPLLTRELLYTAITRARKSVTVLGSRQALIAGAARVIERRTGILERLA